MTELQCSLLAKRKIIPAHGGWRLSNVQNMLNFTTFIKVYREKSHVEASFFHRIL